MSSRTPLVTLPFMLLAILSVACGPIDDPALAVAQYRPECPHTWPDSLHFGEFTAPPEQANLNGPGPIRNVPEFHDCQRFIVPDDAGMRYDSLFGIFATYRLTRLDTLLLAFQGEIEFAADPDNQLTGREGLPAAEIVAWNRYAPLDIRPGFSCLYLYIELGADGAPEWRSRMVSFGPTEQDCSQPVDMSTIGGIELPVTVDTHPRLFRTDDYPAVARWDWDEERREHYIGIRCGPAWCSVAKTGLTASQSYAQRLPLQGDALSDADFRVHHAKGWYDEQLLAIPTSVGAFPRPSDIRGTIIPRPRLDTLEVGHFDGRWVAMAWVALDVPQGVANPYEAKMNLHGTGSQSLGDDLNQIFLCQGTKAECEGVPDTVEPCGDGAWWAAIQNPGGGRVFRCSHRRVMSTASIAATTRWRWLIEDEGVWMRCPEGCCDVTEN